MTAYHPRASARGPFSQEKPALTNVPGGGILQVRRRRKAFSRYLTEFEKSKPSPARATVSPFTSRHVVEGNDLVTGPRRIHQGVGGGAVGGGKGDLGAVPGGDQSGGQGTARGVLHEGGPCGSGDEGGGLRPDDDDELRGGGEGKGSRRGAVSGVAAGAYVAVAPPGEGVVQRRHRGHSGAGLRRHRLRPCADLLRQPVGHVLEGGVNLGVVLVEVHPTHWVLGLPLVESIVFRVAACHENSSFNVVEGVPKGPSI